MGDYRALSHCCALYSAVGIIFMVWVGMMLVHQPFLVGGIEDVAKAKNSAFGAAGTFFFTFLISIVYLIADTQVGGFENMRFRSGNNLRPPRNRGEYDLVSAVQEYHPDDDEEEEHEFGNFT